MLAGKYSIELCASGGPDQGVEGTIDSDDDLTTARQLYRQGRGRQSRSRRAALRPRAHPGAQRSARRHAELIELQTRGRARYIKSPVSVAFGVFPWPARTGRSRCPGRSSCQRSKASSCITLADVRELIDKRLPAEYRAKFTWRQLAGLLRRVAEGEQDAAEVSTSLRMVPQLEAWTELQKNCTSLAKICT